MKKIAAISTLALAMGMGSAFAADLPYRKAPLIVPPPPPALTWTGFYAGVNVGGGWSSGTDNNNVILYSDPRFAFGRSVAGTTNLFFLPDANNSNRSGSGANGGYVGGGQVGYNFQFNPSILIGAEADFQGSNIGNNDKSASLPLYPSPFAPAGVLIPLAPIDSGRIGLEWIGTVRGRAGWLFMPSLLVYGTGGFAYAGVYAAGHDNTRTGWTAGGGLEWMPIANISAKIEYLFADLDSGGTTGGWGWNYGYHHHPQINIVRAGVNYHFNWAAPTPVLAKF